MICAGNRLSRSIGRTVLLLALAGLAWLLFWPGAGRVTLTGLAALLDASEPPRAADAIVVLGGDAEARPFTAAALYRAAYAPQVLLFRHAPDAAVAWGVAGTEDALYRKVLITEGVPDAAILTLPEAVDSTADEAQALRRWLTQQPHKPRLLVVTAREHTRRVAWLLRRVLPAPTQITLIAAPHPRYDALDWWHTDFGLLRYLHELIKSPYYWLRHG
jgi:uncharacterized SAM-binding protein YcdF (DUF218 family)